MEGTMVSVGSQTLAHSARRIAKEPIYDSFVGYSGGWKRMTIAATTPSTVSVRSWPVPFTFGNSYLSDRAQQSVRRFPINLRPLLGITKVPFDKGMGFLATRFHAS